SLLPDHGHHDASDPRRVLAGEGRRGQYLVRGVDMQNVLVGSMLEALGARHDGIVRLRQIAPVVDDVAGMGDPLAAAEKLVIYRIAERIAHAAVMARKGDD